MTTGIYTMTVGNTPGGDQMVTYSGEQRKDRVQSFLSRLQELPEEDLQDFECFANGYFAARQGIKLDRSMQQQSSTQE